MIRIVVLLLAGLALLLGQSALSHANYADREEVKAFARELAQESAFEEAQLLRMFSKAEYKQSIIDAISRPAEKTLTWAEYQDIFLTGTRKRRGREFMLKHRGALLRAWETYGVPPEIITAIIGVETMYGRNKGSYRVLDSLSTLSFDYPPRAKFFRKELKAFFLLAREERREVTELSGSYAGAMGLGQFIPSSYRHYAVDFDGDGLRDIWNNETDAIGSVANYLSEHGWRQGELITLSVDGSAMPEKMFNTSLRPSKTLAELRAQGILDRRLSPGRLSMSSKEKVSPMLLQGKKGAEHWIGFYNFYVITRYNHSKLYAMAVFQLAQSLEGKFTQSGKSTPSTRRE